MAKKTFNKKTYKAFKTVAIADLSDKRNVDALKRLELKYAQENNFEAAAGIRDALNQTLIQDEKEVRS